MQELDAIAEELRIMKLVRETWYHDGYFHLDSGVISDGYLFFGENHDWVESPRVDAGEESEFAMKRVSEKSKEWFK